MLIHSEPLIRLLFNTGSVRQIHTLLVHCGIKGAQNPNHIRRLSGVQCALHKRITTSINRQNSLSGIHIESCLYSWYDSGGPGLIRIRGSPSEAEPDRCHAHRDPLTAHGYASGFLRKLVKMLDPAHRLPNAVVTPVNESRLSLDSITTE